MYLNVLNVKLLLQKIKKNQIKEELYKKYKKRKIISFLLMLGFNGN
jgi:hypothetical protein